MKIDEKKFSRFLKKTISGAFSIKFEKELHGRELLTAFCPHMHNNWELKFVPSELPEENCCITLIPPRRVHAATPDFVFSVEISHYRLRIGHLNNPNCLFFSVNDENFKINTLPELLDVLRKIGDDKRLAVTQEKLMSAILQHLLDLLELLKRSVDMRGSFNALNKALEYIQHNYYISGIGVKDIADFAGVSAQYLNRICMVEQGASLRQLLVKERLTKARELLQKNKYYIKEIARLTGWNCPAYFSNCFRKHYGCYPTQINDCTK